MDDIHIKIDIDDNIEESNEIYTPDRFDDIQYVCDKSCVRIHNININNCTLYEPTATKHSSSIDLNIDAILQEINILAVSTYNRKHVLYFEIIMILLFIIFEIISVVLMNKTLATSIVFLCISLGIIGYWFFTKIRLIKKIKTSVIDDSKYELTIDKYGIVELIPKEDNVKIRLSKRTDKGTNSIYQKTFYYKKLNQI